MKMHLSLRVSDLERSLAFYQAFLGAPPRKQRPGYASFDIADPPLRLALHEGDLAPGAGPLDHLGFLAGSADEVHAARERLRAAGLATFDETDTTCCYARQDKIWVHDPDGNEWEVYVVTDDLWDAHDQDHAGNPLAPGTLPGRSFRTRLPTASGPSCCGGG